VLLQDPDDLFLGKPAASHRLSPSSGNRLTSNRGTFRGAGQMAYILYFISMPAFEVIADFPNAQKEWGQEFYNMNVAKKFDVNFAPKKAVLSSKHKRLPSYFMMRGCLICDEKLRHCVEKLEPGVHQFSEVEFFRKGGKEKYEGHYFLFNVLNLVEAINIERSDENGAIYWSDEFDKWVTAQTRKKNLVLVREKHNGLYLWRDSIFAGVVFASDDLVEELKREKVTGIDFIRIEET
jgi:hypothetical protein